MKQLMESLVKLQEIELSDGADSPATEAKTKELRALIPAPILGHYDRMIARGKKGVVPVRNGVCRGCQMRVAIGAMQVLRQGSDIQLCGTCGRYLYLEEEPAPPAPAPAPAPVAPKPAKARRAKRKPKTETASDAA